MKNRVRLIAKIILGVAVYMLAVLASAAVVRAADNNDTLWQVSTIDALLAGVYDGAVDMNTVKAHGDIGLGTFDALDGEMIVVDGEIWQVRADGKAYAVPNDATTPFAAVTPFESDFTLTVSGATTLADLEHAIAAALPTPNTFYAIKASGSFPYVKTRSVPAQTKPYPPLKQVAAKQPVFELVETSGDIVGFYSPPFAKGTGVPGFHLHFLSADRTSGGHMLDIRFNTPTTFHLDITTSATIQLPNTEAFKTVNLTPDRTKDLHKVEK